MERKLKGTVAVLLASLLLLGVGPIGAGAEGAPVHGSAGGWIPSAGPDWNPETDDAGDAKATFGLQFTVGEVVRGNISYHDAAAEVVFQGIFTFYTVVGQDTPYPWISVGGFCYPSDGSQPGRFSIALVDFGQQGEYNKGYYEMVVSSGAYAGYLNYGPLEGGNMQMPYEQ